MLYYKNIYKTRKLRRAYIFRYLQHFAKKFYNFTNFDMLILAAVKDFVHVAWIKIESIMRIAHYIETLSPKSNSERILAPKPGFIYINKGFNSFLYLAWFMR